MENPQYVNIKTKEKVRILEQVGNFYTLNNGKKIDTQLFKTIYTVASDVIDVEEFMNQKPSIIIENKNSKSNNTSPTIINTSPKEIDPNAFFNTHAQIDGIDTVLTADPSKVNDNQQTIVKDNQYGDAIKIQEELSIEDRKKIAMEEYNINNPQQKIEAKKINENGLTEFEEIWRQDEIQLTGKDPYEEKIRKYKESTKKQTVQIENTQNNIQLNNVNISDSSNNLFKNFKRNHDIVLKLNINEKISKPDFIKIMSDGLEGDIIQYYTDIIYNSFITNTDIIKGKIYEQIYEAVYGGIYEEQNLIEGKPTSKGLKRYKFINEYGKTVDLTIEAAKAKKLKPVK